MTSKEWADECMNLRRQLAESRAREAEWMVAAEPFVEIAGILAIYSDADDSTCEWKLKAGEIRALAAIYRKGKENK